METGNNLNKNAKLPDSTDGLSRRNVLMTATVAASTLAGAPGVLADIVPTGTFGGPLVEVHVPAGVLTLEQKSAMIKGITDVVLGAAKQPRDPPKDFLCRSSKPPRVASASTAKSSCRAADRLPRRHAGPPRLDP